MIFPETPFLRRIAKRRFPEHLPSKCGLRPLGVCFNTSAKSVGVATRYLCLITNADTTFQKARAARRPSTISFPFAPAAIGAWAMPIPLTNGAAGLRPPNHDRGGASGSAHNSSEGSLGPVGLVPAWRCVPTSSQNACSATMWSDSQVGSFFTKSSLIDCRIQ